MILLSVEIRDFCLFKNMLPLLLLFETEDILLLFAMVKLPRTESSIDLLEINFLPLDAEVEFVENLLTTLSTASCMLSDDLDDDIIVVSL